VFCEVAVVLERGFEVSSLGFCCCVDEAIVEIREVRSWRVDGSGSGDIVDIGFYFSSLLLSRFSSCGVWCMGRERVGVLCRESMLDLGCVWACARCEVRLKRSMWSVLRNIN
jgi:hypothetical protein